MNMHLKMYVDKVIRFACCLIRETVVANYFYFYQNTRKTFVSSLCIFRYQSHKSTVDFRSPKANTHILIQMYNNLQIITRNRFHIIESGKQAYTHWIRLHSSIYLLNVHILNRFLTKSKSH